ncbi:MAG: HEAT repeat domain-containing protein [Prochlorococcus sp.]|nr:HEAT repeat domain-containing protein [Prochlorococcaceae cyanobacterium Fu_MAG_50]
MNEQHRLDQAIQKLNGASTSDGVIQATHQLAALRNPDAADVLMTVLGFNNPGAAVVAMNGLIALGPSGVPTILSRLDPQNYGARAWAVRALAAIRDVRGLEVLEEALVHDFSASVRRAAARGLGELNLSENPLEAGQQLERCLKVLIRSCTDDEWVVRYALIFSLERRMLDDPEPTSRPLQAQALKALKTFASGAETVNVVRQRAQLALQRLQIQ